MPEPTADLAHMVLAFRQETGLSQRAFAERAGTSGPAVAAYEAGAKEPRWSTLVRMAAAAGFELEIDPRPSGDPGARHRERRERRRLAVAAATGSAVVADWPAAETVARRNLDRMRSDAPAATQRWVDRWVALVDAGAEAVHRQLLDEGEEADDLRQMTPFAGLLGEAERRVALAVADALT
jgi:transcriptional regulator with XRE-family HTH domain